MPSRPRESKKGAVVTEVAKEKPAADIRLEPGDVITKTGEKLVTGAGDIAERIDEAEKQENPRCSCS